MGETEKKGIENYTDVHGMWLWQTAYFEVFLQF